MDLNCSCVYFRKAECTHYKHPEKECWFLINGKCKPKPKTKTNADRIRAMTDEELAALLSEPCECSVDPEEDDYRECGNKFCIEYLLNWLKQPVEEQT